MAELGLVGSASIGEVDWLVRTPDWYLASPCNHHGRQGELEEVESELEEESLGEADLLEQRRSREKSSADAVHSGQWIPHALLCSTIVDDEGLAK